MSGIKLVGIQNEWVKHDKKSVFELVGSGKDRLSPGVKGGGVGLVVGGRYG